MNTLDFANHTIRKIDADFPEYGENDVLLEHIYAGVDLPALMEMLEVAADNSMAEDFPAAEGNCSSSSKMMPAGSAANPAHFWSETVSRVADFGMNVFDFNYGERVYMLPGRKATLSEACAEMSVVTDAVRNGNIFPLPDSISDLTACLITPFARGCAVARAAMSLRDAQQIYAVALGQGRYAGDLRYKDGENAVIFGGGFVGLTTALMLKWFGMDQVFLCDPFSAIQMQAKAMGIAAASMIPAELMPLMNCWICMDAEAAPSAASVFMSQAPKGSRLIFNENASGQMLLDAMKLVQDQKTILGTTGFGPEDVEDVVAMMSSQVWNLESLIGDVVGLDAVADYVAGYAKRQDVEEMSDGMDASFAGIGKLVLSF